MTRSRIVVLARENQVVFVEEAVFVSEDGDFVYRSGRFSAYLSSGDGKATLEQGPQAVGAEEAIAWGRDRASVVIVCSGDGEERFSAGPSQPPWGELRVWRG